MSFTCLQFQELVIAHPCPENLAQSTPTPNVWGHTLSIQFLINTFSLIQSLLLLVVKKTSPNTQHSTQVDAFPKCALTHTSPKTLVPFRWWSQSGFCFCQRQNLNWFYTHFSASPICFLWSWEETVSLNCVWLLQVISPKPSAGLLGPEDCVFGSFLHFRKRWLHPSVGLNVFYEDGWSTLSIAGYLLNFICQGDAEQTQLSTHHQNFILEALV